MINNDKIRFFIYKPVGAAPREIAVSAFAVKAKMKLLSLLNEEFSYYKDQFAVKFAGLSENERGRATYEFIANASLLFSEFAVMSSQKKGMLGVGELNVFLRDALSDCIDNFISNPDNIEDAELCSAVSQTALVVAKRRCLSVNFTSSEYGEWNIQLGDRLMCTKNDYTNGIYNGECGIVTGINKSLQTFRIQYPDRKHICTYSTGSGFSAKGAIPASEYIIPAYAITIHKSQGSEYRNICLILSPEHRSSLSRNLLYTGISRARSLLSVITDVYTWENAMERNVTQESKNEGNLAELFKAKSHHYTNELIENSL